MKITTSMLAIATSFVGCNAMPQQLAVEAASRTPASLAIYYGYPGLVNGAASDVRAAAAAFSSYDVLVLGDGLQFPDHPDHQRTRAIIAELRKNRRAEVFGYIALGQASGLNDANIRRRVGLWADMGVTGLFYDEAGRDFGVTFERLRSSVASARAYGLTVCINAFDLSAISAGVSVPAPEPLLSALDAILIESFAVRLGLRQAQDDSARQAREALALREQTGVRVFAVTTSVDEVAFRPDDYAYAHRLAAESKLDAFGWGEPGYSAGNSRLPPRYVSPK